MSLKHKIWLLTSAIILGIMAADFAVGYRSIEEVIGRSDLLDTDAAVEHWKASGLDLAPILHRPELPEGTALRNTTTGRVLPCSALRCDACSSAPDQ